MTTATEFSTAITTPTSQGTRGQLARFGTVGVLNTLVDVLLLNLVVWALRIHTTPALLAANAVTYALGAVQSFFLNKHWTFRHHDATTRDEVLRFATTTVGGIALNDLLLLGTSAALLPLLGHTALWANAAKVAAIGGSALISFLGMRLWVFARQPETQRTLTTPEAFRSRAFAQRLTLSKALAQRLTLSKALAHHGISVVLPAYNEAAVIATTLAEIAAVLNEWGADYEIIVVDDGSHDATGAIVTAYAAQAPQVRLIAHPTNLGYGAALADGFAAATRDLTFFMDADGQFAIRDLARLLIHVDEADAVLGYRQQRQDSLMRLANARAWGGLVAVVLGVRVRDLDCAFKVFRTDFLHAHPPETQSALINAELLYKLQRSGATFCQVGVRHLPRQGGRATGANPHVIIRAIRDLAYYAYRWRTQA